MLKNFDDISCILCGIKNTSKDKHCISCHRELDIYDSFVGLVVNNQYTLTEFKGRGFYGITFKALDSYDKSVALKLISERAYEINDKDFDDEARLYAQLPDSLSIVKYVSAGRTSLNYRGELFNFNYIISEWVDGIPIKDLFGVDDLCPEDFIIAARDLLTALQELYSRNLWHNDLHNENILVMHISPAQQRFLSRSSPRLFKIIDIGSMVYRNPSGTKALSDMMNVGSHLFQIINGIKPRITNYSKEDQFMLEILEDVCAQMMDENPSRNFSSPLEALDRIDECVKMSRIS